MRTILILKGLPGSGKTTYARLLVKSLNYIRVNKDDLRGMMSNGQWNRSKEPLIVTVRNNIIVNAILSDLDVVVDDTNFNPFHTGDIEKIADTLRRKHNIKIRVAEETMDTPIEECIKRDLDRAKPVGEKVIREMHDKYISQIMKKETVHA